MGSVAPGLENDILFAVIQMEPDAPYQPIAQECQISVFQNFV
jgi:hypothetical protein